MMRKYKSKSILSDFGFRVTLVILVSLILAGLLWIACDGAEPYDSMNPLRPVPRPTEWPTPFNAATAEAGQPDFFNETNYWALFWAANERIEAVAEYWSQDQKIKDSNGVWQTHGPVQEWVEWPVNPLVFYWSSPIPLGIVTNTYVMDVFGVKVTNTYIYVDFSNENTIVTSLSDTDFLTLSTNDIRFNANLTVEKQVVWGDPNYGELAGGYTETLFDEATNIFFPMPKNNREPFGPGDPFTLNQAEDLFFGAVYGTGKAAGDQWNWLDDALRDLTPLFVNHTITNDFENYFSTSTGTVYRWGIDRDGTGTTAVAGWQEWHDQYPEEVPMWTLDSIGAYLVATGVGGFIEFPAVETNVESVDGWTVGDLSNQIVTVTNVLTNLNRSFRFTLWETNFFEPVPLGYLEISQTNILSADVFDVSRATNGQLVSMAGRYDRTGMTNGKAVLTGSQGVIWWDGSTWNIGGAVGEKWVQGPAHDLFGGIWPVIAPFQGTGGTVHRREINVGPTTHGIGLQDALTWNTVRWQEYPQIDLVVYPNQATNAIDCDVLISGTFARVVNSNTWENGTIGETIGVNGTSGTVNRTSNTFFNLTHLSISSPSSGWVHRLTNNVLPTNHLNGMVIQAEWREPVVIYSPIADDGLDDSPYLINNHQSFWVGLWERAQYINLLKWTTKTGNMQPDRVLTPNEEEPEEGLDDEQFRTFFQGEDTATSLVLVACDWIPDTNTFSTSSIARADFPEYNYQATRFCDNKDYRDPVLYGRSLFTWEKTTPVDSPAMRHARFTDQISAEVEAYHRFTTVGGWQWAERFVNVDAFKAGDTRSAADEADVKYFKLLDNDTADFFNSVFNPFFFSKQGTATKAETVQEIKINLTDGSTFSPNPTEHTFTIYDETDNDTVLTNGLPSTNRWRHKVQTEALGVTFQSDEDFFLMKWNFEFND